MSPAVTALQRRRVGSAERIEVIRRQIEALLAGPGVDLLILETFGYLDELVEAAGVASGLADVPIIAQATFADDAHTLGGETPREVATVLSGLPVAMLGTNCTIGPQRMLTVAEDLVRYASVPVSAQPNAGQPRRTGPRSFEFSIGGDYFARYFRRFAEAGVSLVGGCCGTTPAHVRAAAHAVRPGSKSRRAHPARTAFDLRRCADIAPENLAGRVKQALDGVREEPGLTLEPWVPGRDSLIWRFNQLYWQALSRWEQATGREYEQSLPGGESDARNTEAARELILELFRIWDELDARRALPEELYILELGVGNGSQARTWLDEFVQLDRRHGREYYHRLRYLMGDYSPHVLDRARQAVAHHGERVSALVVEATRPAITLGFLAQKAFLVYISNVYDNLPTDELASIHGRTYQVETQAFLTEDDTEAIAVRFGARRDDLVTLIDRLLRIGPELLSESNPGQFASPGQAVAFWRAAWEALRLRERYVPLEGLDSYQVTPALTGEIIRPLIEGHGDVRMHVSNGALGSFTGTLPLLHPYGRRQCHDLFLTGSQQYRTGFYGPGKYDGSVVNWVNGPLLQLVASRRGFGVEFTPFRQRPGSNITTLTAQARD